MEAAGNWSTIESDPGVFTELIERLGVTGVQVEELFDLSQLEDLRPVYGLIFLFKYQPSPNSGPIDHTNPNVFFAKQVIQNSCATQAILSILMNRDVSLGSTLSNFKSFTAEFSPDLKGWAISNSEEIRTHHNSFARSDPFISEGMAPSDDDEDLFHFISYLPVDNTLYELDGLREGPINHGPCTDEDWMDKVRPVIETRIAAYAANEIRFNLLAIIKNRADVYMEELENPDISDAEREQLFALLTSVQQKQERWHKENARRQHNFIGFTFALLKGMAEKGVLKGQLEKAEKISAKEREMKKAKMEQQKQGLN